MGLCMAQLVLSQPQSCLVLVHKPHIADTSAFSLHQLEHPPSGLGEIISSTPVAEIQNPMPGPKGTADTEIGRPRLPDLG